MRSDRRVGFGAGRNARQRIAPNGKITRAAPDGASATEGGGESGIRTHGRVSPTHAFQACSFNHSDISPFRINSLRAVADQITRNGLDVLAFYDHVWIQWLRDVEEQLVAEIV